MTIQMLNNNLIHNNQFDLQPPATKLLLHFDGANGSTVITDERGHTVTAVGNAQISTAQSKFGGSSGLVDGTGDYFNIADAADLSIGTSLFTLETWIYGINVSGRRYYIDKRSADYRGWCLMSQISSAEILFCAHYSSGWDVLLSSGQTLSTGVWQHLAVSRISPTAFEMHVDGTRVATATVAAAYSIEQCTTDLRIGWTAGTPNEYANCYFEDIRLVIGQAVYSGATITVPTSALTVI